MSEIMFNRNLAEQGQESGSRPQNGTYLTMTKRVHLIGAVVAFSTVISYFVLYLQTGVWQILANSLGVGIALISIGAGYYSLLKGKPNRTAVFGLMAVIIAYVPGELFWKDATVYNLVAALILLILVGLVLRPSVKVWTLMVSIFLGLVVVANVFEPFTRYSINQSPILKLYLPAVAVILIAGIGWQLARVFFVGNIRSRLILAFLVVTLIPLILLAIINNRLFQISLENNARQALFAVASEAGNTLDTYLGNSLTTIASEAQIPALVDYLSLSEAERREESIPERSAALETLNALGRKDTARIQSYALIDANGINIVDTVSVYIGQDEYDSEYFQAAGLNEESYVSSVIFPEMAGGTAVIYVSTPVIDQQNNTLGILRYRLDASILQDIVKESNDLAGEESFGVLFAELGDNFIHLAHGTAPETIYTSLIPYSNEELLTLQAEGRIPTQTVMGEITLNLTGLNDNLAALDEATFFTATDVATGDRVNQVAIVRLDVKSDWVIAFFQPEDIFLSSAQQQTTSSIVLVIIFSILVAGAAVVVARLLANPISNLTEVARKVASGDLKARAEVGRDDEIGVLASTFNSMTEQLDDVISNLEATIALRTEALERRAAYLEAAADVGRSANVAQDLDEMLDSVTHLISDRFGFYHVGILLVDTKREYAVLRASNSEGGWRMMARGHRLRIGEQGIVGFVTSAGEARVEQSVAGEEGAHFSNPELPLTRSELALPLMAGDEILGALDVQSTEEEAFSDEDVTVLQVLADQVAMALNNRLLLGRIQESLEAERRAYGEISKSAWVDRLQLRSNSGYTSDGSQIYAVISDQLSAEASMALESGTTILASEDIDSSAEQAIAIPIKTPGNVILGLLETKKPMEQGPWSTQEIRFLEAISGQLGSALENARLLEETERVAVREGIAADVTSQLWASTDVNTILQTAVEELGKALDLSTSTIQLNIETEANAKGGKNAQSN